MTRRHPIISLILAIVLGLTSVTMAVARSEMLGSTETVICAGYGVVSLTLDAEGNPTGPAHHCPDCLTGAATALWPTPSAQPVRPATRAAALRWPADVTGIAASTPAPLARGPPQRI